MRDKEKVFSVNTGSIALLKKSLLKIIEKEDRKMTLKELQEHFFRLYGRRNRIFLSSLRERIDFLNLAIGDLQEAIRKEYNPRILGIALARVVSRIFGITENFWSLPFREMMARKYPKRFCSYCRKFPCVCPERRPGPILELVPSKEQLGWSLKDWCQYLNLLYGKRNKIKGIENLTNRLFKEIAELLSLQMMIPNTNDNLDEIEKKFALELSDALAWTIAIANFFKIDIERAVLDRYGKCCWKCQQIPCICTIFNMKQIKWEEAT